ncbi:MAG TPA: GspH/FimT family pseudopilin [Steroidobacteraceae bacterium]|nr:GspH/FimT family pseudopilin [Steroidobacteraceae bacterium]
MRPKSGHAGFTVTELVVVMLIVAILAGIGIPSYKYVTTSNRLAGEINGLLGDMQFARSEAIKQGLPVTVCSSPTPQTACGNSHWQNGWIVFLDSNGNGVVDPGEAIIRTRPDFSANGDTLQPFNNVTFSSITFNREGYGSTNTPVPQTVTLLLHDSTANSQWTRCLAITTVGMLSTQRVGPTNPDCT